MSPGMRVLVPTITLPQSRRKTNPRRVRINAVPRWSQTRRTWFNAGIAPAVASSARCYLRAAEEVRHDFWPEGRHARCRDLECGDLVAGGPAFEESLVIVGA